MQLQGIQGQSSYLSFKGAENRTSRPVSSNIAMKQITADTFQKQEPTKTTGINWSKLFNCTKPLTDEEIRIANKSGKLPERYCVKRTLNGSYVRYNEDRYKLVDLKYKPERGNRYSPELPEGYKIARKKNTDSVKLVNVENNLSDNWEIL